MSSPEDWGYVPPVEDAPTSVAEHPSLLNRAGRQLGNAPSDILNDMMRLLYNTGLRSGEQTEAVEVARPFDIPEPQNWQEQGVDLGSELVKTLPLFLSGEGAGAGLARLSKAGPMLSRMMKVGGGFATQGLSESPEQAASGAVLGTGFGAVEEMIPGKAKYLAALGLGLGTGIHSKLEGASDQAATTSGIINTVLPLLFGKRAAKSTAKSLPENIEVTVEPPPGYGKNIGLTQKYDLALEGENIPRLIKAPDGALVKEPTFTQDEALTIARNKANPKPLLRLLDENQGELPFRNSNGSVDLMQPPTSRGPMLPFMKEGGLTEEPIFTQAEARRAAGVTAPEGSLIREPAFTEAEARRAAGVKAPEGSLIREPTFTEDESLRYAKTQQEKVATLQPETPSAKAKDRLLLSTVLSPENETMARKAAEKLGLEFSGIQGVDTATPLILFTSTKNKSTFSIPVGATYKDLKNKQAEVAKRMSAPKMTAEEARAKLAELRAGSKEKGGISSVEVKVKRGENFETEGVYDVAIGENKFKIFRDPENGWWYDNADMGKGYHPLPIGFNKKEALSKLKDKVATLQKENPAPSPLETPLPHGLKVGDVAETTIGGEKVVGKIQPSVESKLPVRLVESDGTAHDLAPDEIFPFGKTPKDGKQPSVLKDLTEEQAGEKELLGGSGGKMKLSNFGEHGGVPPEVLSFIGRYMVAPAIGGAAGYVFPENDNQRLGFAIAGAISAGLLARKGFKLAGLLAEGHPEVKKAGTFAEKLTLTGKAVADDSRSLAKAITGNEKMAERSLSRWGLSTPFEELARMVEKNVGTHPAVTRFLGKAYGKVELLSEAMRKSIKDLSHIDGIDKYHRDLTAFFEGKMTVANLRARTSDEIAGLASTAAQSRTALQNIAIEGLGPGKLATAIGQSVNRYLTTAYKVFHDPKYRPSDLQIEAAAKSLSSDWGSLDTRLDLLHDYLAEIKANQGLYLGSGTRKGAALDALLSKQKDLTPEFKAMLGEYKNPLERMAHTAIKLVNGGRSAEFFNEVARGIKENGLKYAYTTTEREVQIATLQQKARLAHSPAEREAAAAALNELKAYVKNSDGLASGKLGGKWLDRRMHDQLANYHESANGFSSAWMRGVVNLTNSIKYGQIILSPLQFVRQVYSMPILGIMAKITPVDLMKAFKTINDKSAAGRAELERLKRLGVYGGDPVGGMLRKDMKFLMDGTLDRVIGEKLAGGLHRWEEFWRQPDLMIRVGAFKRKEAQLLEEGFAKNVAEDMAIDHMNRYTMNYAAVPPIVQKGRQMPFINQYLSFAYEAMRIAKNLGEDAVKGDPAAIGALATVATAPFIVQQMSEMVLSPKDREEWKKVKEMGRDYERHNFRIVTGRLPNGDFKYILFSPLVPHDPWLQSVRAIMAGDTSAAMAANPVFGWENTPLLNVATTLVSGRNRFTGQKLNGIVDYEEDIRKQISPLLIGTDLDRIMRAITPNEEGGRGVIDSRTGKVSSISDIIQTYATSMRPYTVRPSYLQRQAQAETVDRIRSQQLILRQVLSTNASPEEKQKAKDNFQRITQQILASFKDKLGASPPVPSGE